MSSSDSVAKRVNLRGRSLRVVTAQGSIINGAFMVGLSGLSFVKAFIVARFLTPEDYGIWGLVTVGVVLLAALIEIGIGDKYIQQDSEDEETAYHKAFTLYMLTNLTGLAIMACAVPGVAWLTGEQQLLGPGFALLLMVPAAMLLTPLWVFYRRMDFLKQRLVLSVDPLVAFVVTVALAVAGMGFWSFVIGSVAGIWTAAITALIAGPYKPRWNFDRAIAREYISFSWPLFVSNISWIILLQVTLFVGEWQLGLAGAGAITLATNVSALTNKADKVITQTLYPAICAVKDKTDVLFETFVKSNRLALMWGMPFGLSLSLFTDDLIANFLGGKWLGARDLLIVFGATAAISHIGFNWDAFYRARGDTRPIAILAGLGTAAHLGIGIPLMITDGLTGYAIGMAIQAAIILAIRLWFLQRLFAGFGVLRHALRAVAPSVPAVACVLLMRVIESGERTGTMAATEMAVYLVVTIASTFAFERELLREIGGYVRGRGAPAPAPSA